MSSLWLQAKVCEIPGHQQKGLGHGLKIRDCPAHAGTLGNYVYDVFIMGIQYINTSVSTLYQLWY